ncbi:MAG: alpha/beta hydrolase fold domain-containing protein [Pyrinomonadaceae bacterium]
MIKSLVLTSILVFIASNPAFAQISEAGKWAIKAYTVYGFSEANITYKTINGKDVKLDVYRPKTGKLRPRPTLLFFHGGGWRAGSKDSYSLRVLPWLERGWNVVSADYRVTGEARAPAAVEDAACALRWVFQNSPKYGFDTNQIVVSGQSAGGHLALMAGLAYDEPAFSKDCDGAAIKPAAIVNWFGITDVADLLQGEHKTQFASNWIGADRFADSYLISLVSPITFVSSDAPPTITIHGEADPLVPYSQAIRLHQLLNDKDVKNQLFTVKGGDHGDFSFDDSLKAYEAVFAFLEEVGIRTENTKLD